LTSLDSLFDLPASLFLIYNLKRLLTKKDLLDMEEHTKPLKIPLHVWHISSTAFLLPLIFPTRNSKVASHVKVKILQE